MSHTRPSCVRAPPAGRAAPRPRFVPSASASALAFTGLLAVHALLLGWEARGDGPTWDEVGHFAAGVEHWRHGSFRFYRVNPPLVRLVATAPLVMTRPDLDVEAEWVEQDVQRPEFVWGGLVARRAGRQYPAMLAAARWACIPFSLVGAWVCFRWARELYGTAAGFLALALWVFSPTVLGYGHLITPDLGAAALGVAACYGYARWLRRPTMRAAVLAGLLLGLAELTKTTWLILVGAWPFLWLLCRRDDPARSRIRLYGSEALGIGLMLVLALWVVNLGYGFEGTFKAWRDYRFVSQSLSGDHRTAGAQVESGRAATGARSARLPLLGRVPVPLPESYLVGIDFVKMEYERKYWSYLRGQWRFGGWWYYYLYAMAVKEPLGTWLIAAVAVGAAIGRVRGYAAPWREELPLLLPAVAVIALVSSQTGFNHHLRYVLPAFPFLFIWVSKVARSVQLGQKWVAAAAGVALAWSVASSLSAFPHSMSYFNELAGGPRGGHWHLGNSNADWGQDLLYLKKWYDRHPEARPLHLAYDLPLIDPRMAGIEWDEPPPAAEARPGWYALSVNRMHAMDGRLRPFLELEPVATAGYSIYIYHLSPADADRLRLLAATATDERLE